MSEEREHEKKSMDDPEEVKAILGAVSKEVPALIKGIISSVFSENAGRDMGKGAAAFYKELKEGGMPDEVAVKMTENYISVFTNIGDIMKKFGKAGKINISSDSELGKEIEEKIRQKLAEEGITDNK
jgi:hypothetical protein